MKRKVSSVSDAGEKNIHMGKMKPNLYTMYKKLSQNG
jgi:hypothetical protein